MGETHECTGINSRKDLAEAIAIVRKKKLEELMDQGVTITDPSSTFIDAEVKIGKDTLIHPFTIISGKVTIGENCEIGPFARIREDVLLKDNACVGNFVEIKKSVLGKGAKAKHLAYLGNATLAEKVNIGAGTITANYDGVRKHPTYIGKGSKIGSNTVIVAPNHLGNYVTVGAGTVIPANKKIPDHSLIYGVPGKIAKNLLTIKK